MENVLVAQKVEAEDLLSKEEEEEEDMLVITVENSQRQEALQVVSSAMSTRILLKYL